MLLVALLGAAMAQPAAAPLDVKSIAGTWSGTAQTAGGSGPLQWTIGEDGKVDVVAGTTQGNVTGVARISVEGDRFFYQSETSSGPVTLREEGGRRTLTYDATFKRDGSRASAELTQRR
jgi:hypothetical protein